ncbi:hypothetical protein FB451DRAFT_1384989 [Mycena latifolia]|nr:hypothetical protein FB451DRAFT_1384989 [Mycena latifolia]
MSADIGKLTTPVFVGTLLNWALFGVLCVQVGIYFTVFKDRPYSKILVSFVFVLEILATLANTRDTIRVFGAGWGNMDILDEVGWAWFSVPIIGSISAAVGQGFFARRIYILGQKNLYVPALIIALTALQLGAGIWSGVEICLARTFSHLQLQNTNVKPADTWLAASSACDLIIVSSMAFHLLKSRNPDFRYTNAILSRILRMTVETGLLCAVFAIADLYLITKYEGTYYHLGLCIPLSKVYSNSILLILNSRAHITHDMPPAEVELNLSNLVFSGTKVSTRAEMNNGDSSVHMDSEGQEGEPEV